MPLAIVGHAIVSADGKIADRDGRMPAALRIDADWHRFQAALDASNLVVLGRTGHRLHPNPGRKRLVVTSSVAWLERDDADENAMLWNPAGISFARVLKGLGMEDGTIAITGGQRVFDLFLPAYTRFDLVEVAGVILPGGLDCFSSGAPGQVLFGEGLEPASESILAANATLTVWQRNA